MKTLEEDDGGAADGFVDPAIGVEGCEGFRNSVSDVEAMGEGYEIFVVGPVLRGWKEDTVEGNRLTPVAIWGRVIENESISLL
jgi:hypothetical protein